jgi:hypothetical protein
MHVQFKKVTEEKAIAATGMTIAVAAAFIWWGPAAAAWPSSTADFALFNVQLSAAALVNNVSSQLLLGCCWAAAVVLLTSGHSN